MTSPPPTAAEPAAPSALRQAIRAAVTGQGDVRALEFFQLRFPRLIEALLSYRTGCGNRDFSMSAAHEAFLRGGSNVRLYERVTNELAALYPPHQVLLDVGCGEGHALLPALQKGGVSILEVVLIEPYRSLLRSAETRLNRWVPGLEIHAHATTLEVFLDRSSPDDYWTIAQATFSLSAIPQKQRWRQLKRLRNHVGRLVVVEFDVSNAAARDDFQLLDALGRIELALGEYGETGELVAHGVLLPMLVRLIDDLEPHQTIEHSMDYWVRQLTDVGYEVKEARHLCDHFRAPVFLLVAEAKAD